MSWSHKNSQRDRPKITDEEIIEKLKNGWFKRQLTTHYRVSILRIRRVLAKNNVEIA